MNPQILYTFQLLFLGTCATYFLTATVSLVQDIWHSHHGYPVPDDGDSEDDDDDGDNWKKEKTQ